MIFLSDNRIWFSFHNDVFCESTRWVGAKVDLVKHEMDLTHFFNLWWVYLTDFFVQSGVVYLTHFFSTPHIRSWIWVHRGVSKCGNVVSKIPNHRAKMSRSYYCLHLNKWVKNIVCRNFSLFLSIKSISIILWHGNCQNQCSLRL